MKNRYFKFFIYLLIIWSISYLLIDKINGIGKIELFQITSLFTYFGVIIGFAITIYTFSLSMVSEIREKIQNSTIISLEKKGELKRELIEGFNEVKEDIWLVFYSIVLLIINKGLSLFYVSCFDFLEKQSLVETFNFSLFVLVTIAMWDIMNTMFNLSEINLHLNDGA